MEILLQYICTYIIYLYYIPQRIYNALGENIKFIFMLRNPINRACSHYWMSYRRDYEKETFEKAIELEKERIETGQFAIRHFNYVDRGFYSKQIKRFLKYFPRENMQFIIFEDFIKNVPKFMSQIFF